MITEESMEEISSASDGDLEDGEIIDDSDSDLSIFNISNSRQHESKHPSASRGSDIHLIPLRSLSPKKRFCKSKENKKVDPDSFNLLIKIPGKVDSTKVEEVQPRRKTRCHHRRKKVNKIYEDWSRSISLLTSPKKRKKTNASPHKYDSCESLNKEWRSSKKACPELKLNPVITKGNALLTKLVSTGDISPSSVILKEKNQKNIEKPSIFQCVFADIDADGLMIEKSEEKSSVFCSALSDVSSDELAAGTNVEKSSVYRSALSDISSDELVSHNLTMKNCHSSRENLFESPNTGSSSKSVKVSSRSDSPLESCIVYIEEASKTSEISPVKSHISEISNDSALIDKNMLQLNLELLKTPPQCDDFYSPETFIPFNLDGPQNSETLELHNSLRNENDFLSENYDCIPMSCSEDEEGSSDDSKTEKQKDFPLQRPQTEEDEEEEELRLRISALKTWLQRKYAKSKPGRNIKSSNDNTVSQETLNIDRLPHMTENIQSPPVEIKIISKQNEEIKVENSGDKEVILESEEIPSKQTENSFIDDEASENYEQALRSLLVSNLLKKKLKNSNELLTESCLMNKASSYSELLNKPPSKNPHNASSNSRSNSSLNVANSSSKCRTVSSIKNSNQTLKNSANQSDSINCDNFQSKYVFSNLYEPPNQLEDSKYLSSISNFKLPIVDKLIIHLSEDSDYDSDESLTQNVTKTLLDKKSVGPSKNNCLRKAAVKSTMDVPNPLHVINSSTEPCVEFTTTNESNSANNSEEYDSVKLQERNGKESKQLPAEAVPNKRHIKAIRNSSFEVENFNNATKLQAVELSSNISATIVWNSIEKSAGLQESNFTSSPDKIASDLLINFNGSNAPFTHTSLKSQELNEPNAKEKSKKTNSALVADVLVPLEKKLLKSRLNMLQNVGSMQSCVNSCEENALKCSKSFSKIVLLQKALKQATSDYKTHFSRLKSCLQSYKAHSEKISSCLKDYALAQKDCVWTGKQIIGSNYKTPKEGMSAMATKFKLLKEKKMELLKNASIANEIKKANFSTDASSKTISAALKNVNLNYRSTTSSKNVSHDETDRIPLDHLRNFSKDLNVDNKASTKNSPKETVMRHSVIKGRTCNQENFTETTSLPTVFDEPTQSKKVFRDPKTIVDELRQSGGKKSNMEISASVQCGAVVTQPEVDASSSVKTDSMTRILSPPPLPKPLLAMLDVIDPQNTGSDEIFECQQKFKKYTPVFQSLCSYQSVNNGFVGAAKPCSCSDDQYDLYGTQKVWSIVPANVLNPTDRYPESGTATGSAMTMSIE